MAKKRTVGNKKTTNAAARPTGLEVQDSSSFLEYLRAYQLWPLFGKYKLF